MTEEESRREKQRTAELALAIRLTNWVRSSSDPEWVAIRERLRAEGVAPDDAAVGTMFPDDTKLAYGVILTRDGGSFEFDIEEQPDGTYRLLYWAPFPRARAGVEWFDYAQAVLDSDPPGPAAGG